MGTQPDLGVLSDYAWERFRTRIEGLTDADAWLAVLAVPLAVNASVVLVAGGAPSEDLRERERVTATARRRP